MPTSIRIGPDNRIWADIPWADGNGPKLAKRIAGVRPKFEKNKTSPNGKDKFVAWTYPLDMNTCRQFREVFGKSLQVDKALADWARGAIKRENAMIELGRSDGEDINLFALSVIAPELSKAVDNRPYQKVGAKFILDGGKVCIADQPGLGKTLETLAALAADPTIRRVLVFAPATAMESVWARESKRWVGADVFLAVGTPTARRSAIVDGLTERPDGPMQIVICNPEMVRTKKTVKCADDCGGDLDCPYKPHHVTTYEHKYPDLFITPWDAIVVDECHKSLIGKNVMSKSISQTRLGMMLLPVRENGKKVALSGTPYRGMPELLWGVMNWLRPDVFTSFWRWAESYFEMFDGWQGARIIGDMREDRMEAYDKTVAPYLLRRTKEEVAKDLPPKMYGGTPLDPDKPNSAIGVWLEMEPAQRKHYVQMAAESEANLDGGIISAIGVLPEMTRLKQFAICQWRVENGIIEPYALGNKYNWLVQFLTERKEEGKKVVVASQYTKVINAFAAQLTKDGFDCAVLTGEVKQKGRAALVADFQDNPDGPQVFLINTMAGGVAITLDAADDLVFLDETYIPDDQEQVEDRIHRVSRIHQVTIWNLRSLGTIEESICRITEARETAVKDRLDGSRGIEFAKLMLNLTHEENRRRWRSGV